MSTADVNVPNRAPAYSTITPQEGTSYADWNQERQWFPNYSEPQADTDPHRRTLQGTQLHFVGVRRPPTGFIHFRPVLMSKGLKYQ